MAREVVNSSLKDHSIVALLPAPETTREGGVFWYDVSVDPESLSSRLDAVDKDGNIVETIEAQTVAPNEFKLTSQLPDGPTLEMTLTVSQANDATEVRARFVDGREVLLTESGVEFQDTDAKAAHDGAPRGIGDHWQHVVDPLFTLSEALKIRAADSNSWGCTSCMVLLGGMAAGTFVAVSELNPAVGVGVVVASATFIENCEGSCA